MSRQRGLVYILTLNNMSIPVMNIHIRFLRDLFLFLLNMHLKLELLDHIALYLTVWEVVRMLSKVIVLFWSCSWCLHQQSERVQAFLGLAKACLFLFCDSHPTGHCLHGSCEILSNGSHFSDKLQILISNWHDRSHAMISPLKLRETGYGKYTILNNLLGHRQDSSWEL